MVLTVLQVTDLPTLSKESQTIVLNLHGI